MEKEEILKLDLPLKYLYPFVRKESAIDNGLQFHYDKVDIFLCKEMLTMFIKQWGTISVFRLTYPSEDKIDVLGRVYNANMVPVPRYNEKGYEEKLLIDIGEGARYGGEYTRKNSEIPKSISEIRSENEKHNYTFEAFDDATINLKTLNEIVKSINASNYKKALQEAIEQKKFEEALSNVDKFYSELL